MTNKPYASATVAILAGGTGGHIFPAIAVAKKLQAQGVNIIWLGTSKGLEADLVPKHGFQLALINIEGIRGRGVKALLKAPWLLAKSIVAARTILKQHQVNAVLGMGGFVAGPGGVAAKTLGIPVVIHEQNSVAGTTNKLLSKISTIRFVAFPNALPNAIWCGNPVRDVISALPVPQQRGIAQHDQPIKLLVLGGSRGALAINKIVPETIALLPEESRPTLWHQTGADHIDLTLARYEECGVQGKVEPFIDDMAAAYAWADVVICRAGALTISELTAVGLAAILIPFPYAIDDHQTVNGAWLVDAGAAKMIQQSAMDAKALCELYLSAVNPKSRLLDMANAGRALAKPDAAQQVADACLELCHG